MASKTLAITYTADAQKALAAQRAIDAGHTKMTGGLSKTSGAFQKTFGSMIPLGYAAAGAAAVGAAKFIIDAASSEGEALNKAQVVFGKSAESVVKFSDQSASAFGISKGAALEAAAGYGSMFESAGLAEDASASMSTVMVKLAADMASFNNQDPTEMLDKLRSGLAGEAEPLRQFGVFLSEAAVNTEAYASGIAKTGAELTDAQKVQARYNIIMEQTAKQQGDFARTIGDSLPNQIRKFKAQLTDLAADIGSVLLPALSFLIDNLSLVLTGFLAFAALKFLPSLLLSIATALEDLGFVAASAKFLSIADGAVAMGGAFTTAAGAAAAFAVAFGGLTAALAAWDPLGLVGDTDALRSSMEVNTKAFGESGVMLGRVAVSSNLVGESFAAATPTVGEMKAKADMANAGLTNLSGGLEKTRHEAVKAGDVMSKMGKEIVDGLRGELPAIIGTAVTYKDTFSLSPSELKKITSTWVQIGKTMAADLKEIAQSDLKPQMREAIASLPPEMRHAWAEGTAKEKNNIESDLKKTFDLEGNINRLAKQAVQPANSGGLQIGKAITQGMTNGLNSGTTGLYNTIDSIVATAIARAKTKAGVASPSTVFHELGLDMMAGLSNGLTDGMGGVVSAVDDASDKLGKAWLRTAKNLEARSSDIKDDLDKLKQHILDFRTTIQQGFNTDLIGGLLGLEEGADPSAFLSDAVANAQAFGDALKGLQKAGLAKGLVGQIASQGVSALPLAQQLLNDPELLQQFEDANKAILSVATSTADKLVESAFGPAADKLADRMERFAKRVGDFTDALHADAVDREVTDVIVALRRLRQEMDQQLHGGGQATADLTQTVRAELIRLGRRNGGTGI